MPGFVSHTLMAQDVYNKLDNKNVNLDYMVTYSLGGDLSKYAKCRYDSHHKDMDKFIYIMADYIKERNLKANEKILGVLYGHICHYIMDDVIHPLVRSVSKSCIYGKHKHTLIEFYYDNYLVNKRYPIKKKEYLKNILNVGSDKDINMMLNYVYKKVYQTDKISRYYDFNLFLYCRLKEMYQFFGNTINKIIGLYKFVNNNKGVNLLNNDYKINYHDSLRNESCDDLDSLYNLSIDLAYEYIKIVNKYLTNK